VYDDPDQAVFTFPGATESLDESGDGTLTTTGPIQMTRTWIPYSYTDSSGTFEGTYAETLDFSGTVTVTGGQITLPGFIEGDSATSGPANVLNLVGTGSSGSPQYTIQSLSRALYNTGNQELEMDAYPSLSTSGYLATAPNSPYSGSEITSSDPSGNYNATTYGYDGQDNQDKVVSPTGTITRTVYDGFNRVVSVWVGTNDTVTGYWSPTNSGSMTETTAYTYDYGGSGDGDLTQQIQYPGGGQPNRVTDYYYDWRDRKVVEKDGVQSTETIDGASDGTHRPLYYYTYDNLNELVETDQYDGDGLYDYSSTPPSSPDLLNGSFEETTVIDGQNEPTDWTVSDDTTGTLATVVTMPHSDDDEAPAPDGANILELGINYNDSGDAFPDTVSQTISDWSAGNYILSLSYANSAEGPDALPFTVSLDGTVVDSVPQSAETTYSAYTRIAIPIMVTSGSHTITITSVEPPGGESDSDNVEYVDAVSIQPTPALISPAPETETGNPGVPNPPSSSVEVAKTVTSYDELGRVYQTTQTPLVAGTAGSPRITNSYYDLSGNLIETRAYTGVVSKTQYDGADRAVSFLETDGAGGTSWADAFGADGDNVIQETDNQFDADGNIIFTATHQYDSASSASSSALPAGWSDAGIGSPTDAGSASFNGTTWTVNGSGYNGIAASPDQLNFASQTLSGDLTLVAKVTSLSDTSELAQAGIMVRADSSSTSAFGAIVDTPSDGIRFYWRNSDGGTSDHRTITGSTAEWVKLTYVNGVVDAYYSSDGLNWTEVFEPEAFSSIPTSVSAGLMVSAHSSGLATGTFTNVALTPTTLPSGWSDTDIGSPGIPGGASFDGTTWTVAGGGGSNDIGGGGSDQFNFASQSLSGNATFIAKVTSLSDTSSIAKAGVMFRADNTASANFAAVIETPDGPQLRWRNSDGTPHHTDASTTTMPMWVKLVYSSGVATGYYSTNGTAWTQVGSSESVSLPSTYLAGLAAIVRRLKMCHIP
jgi:regulation of enolase protein 1 (concanavalin A-like superfamily)